MHHIRTAVTILMIASSLVCVSVLWGKPRPPKAAVLAKCASKQASVYASCINLPGATPTLCEGRANNAYYTCVQKSGYANDVAADAPTVPGKPSVPRAPTSGSDAGNQTSTGSTTTGTKTKHNAANPKGSAAPTAIPKAKPKPSPKHQ